MDWTVAVYYFGCALSLILCWKLGPLFYSLVLFNIVTDVLLSVGWLAYGDMRLKWAIIEGLYCLWVLILANVFRSRVEAVIIFLLIAGGFSYLVYPSLTAASSDWREWVELTTRIMEGWSFILTGLIAFVVGKSLLLWKLGRAPNDLIVNPRKRFLLPIWAWAIITVYPLEWIPGDAEWFATARFPIGTSAMVWGWVFLELKFFVQAQYWRKKYGNR